MTQHPIGVLVVGDQVLARAGLRGTLCERDGFAVVGELGSGDGVIAMVDRLRPDVVVVDVPGTGVDRVAAVRALRDHGHAPPVLVLSSRDDDEILAGALRAGAAGFLLKDVRAEDLRSAVRTVAAGGGWLDPAITGRVLAGYRDGAAPVVPGTRVGLLTPRERDVLALIGAGLSNAEIARTLFVGRGTVKTHIGHIFAKLDLRDRAAAVVFAFDHGLVRPGGPRPLAV